MDITPFIHVDRHALAHVYLRGMAGGFRDLVLEMAQEAEQALIADCYRASILMSAETVHRINCELILQYGRRVKPVQLKPRRSKELISLDANNIRADYEAAFFLLRELTIAESIKILQENRLVDDQTIFDMQALRFLRNSAVHRFLLPIINWHDPPTIKDLSIHDIVQYALKKEFLPRQFVGFRFKIEVGDQELEYIVDQERLDIDIEALESEQQYPVIALALLHSSARTLAQKMAIM